MKNTLLYLVCLLLIPLSGISQHVELGLINWYRNYDEAIKRANKEDKDILILFQEVPGCSTCQNYGNNVLSHPLIVECVEDNFIPLAIFNNHKGHDWEILSKFKEPSWNNPVVRIVSTSGQDVTPRLTGQYSSLGLVNTILQALDERSIVTPKYLQLLYEELQPSEELVLGMYCFWSGEKVIGNLRGVTHTEAGYMGGHEVVKIKYDPNYTDIDEIITSAKSNNCADIAFVESNNQLKSTIDIKPISKYRKDKEDKYYLIHSKYRYLNLSPGQATKVNSYLGQGLNPEEWLSPRQLAELK